MPLALTEEAQEKVIKSIRRYFKEQLDQDLGELQAGLLLEYVLKEIAPSIYNAAIADAQVYLRDRIVDLDGACFAPEFTYWKQPKDSRSPR